MDAFVLKAIVGELDRALAGARLQKAAQPRPDTVVLAFEGGRALLLSADARHPRIHLIGEREPGPPEAPLFCRSLRKHLAGCRLRRVHMRGWERVVQLSFERPEAAGATLRFALIAEIMGRWSNLLLLDGGGRILDCLRTVGERMSRARPLERNAPYRLPPAPEKADPEELDEEALRRLLPAPDAAPEAVARALVRSIAGISPAAAEEIVGRVPPAGRWGGLWAPFSEAVRAFREEAFRPAVLLDERGAAAGLTALATPRRTRAYPSMNEAAEAFYAEAIARADFQSRRAALGRAFARRAERVRRALGRVEEDLRRAERTEEQRALGELLLANLGRVEEKAEAVALPAEGETVRIPLDPRLSPAANAQRYFKRYKKWKRLRTAGGRRRAALARELAFYEGLLFDLEEAEGAEELEMIRESAGEEVPGAKGPPVRTARRRARPWRRFVSPRGWEIFVGKNAAGNDRLLREIGRPADLWLHAQGVPGSHVLLRGPERGGAPPEEALRLAASLAAHYSRGRAGGKQPVDWVPFSRVKRPRGAPPGVVTFTGQRTLVVPPAGPEALADALEEKE